MKKILFCSCALLALSGLMLLFTSNLHAGDDHHGHKNHGKAHLIKMKDPVSGKVLTEKSAKASTIYKDAKLYFESEDTKKEFADNQDKYFETLSNDYHFYTNQAYAHYFHIQESLAADSTKGVQKAASAIADALNTASHLTPSLEKSDLKSYQDTLTTAYAAAVIMANDNDSVENMRKLFWPLSESMISFSSSFNKSTKAASSSFVFHCSMALDGNGASWLQQTNVIGNPYFGSSMLRCGKLTETHMAICSITGDELADPDVKVKHEGMTYYFCCKGCIKDFKSDPEKYIYGESSKEHKHGDDHDHHDN